MRASLVQILRVLCCVRRLLTCATLVLCLWPMVLYGADMVIKEVAFATAERTVLMRLFAAPDDGPHATIVLAARGEWLSGTAPPLRQVRDDACRPWL